VEHGRAAEQVEAGAVGPPAAPLHLEGRLGTLGGRGPAQVGQDRVVAGLGQVGDGAVQQLGLGVAEELAGGAVDAQEAAVQADQRHPDGGLVETEAEIHPAPGGDQGTSAALAKSSLDLVPGAADHGASSTPPSLAAPQRLHSLPVRLNRRRP
jgi:hypothetical protein